MISASLATPQTAVAAAGINKQINFQGKVVNANGTNVPNDTYNIEFKMYTGGTGCVSGGTAPCGGTLQWTETRLRNNAQGVVVTDGIFQVNLGSVNPLPTIFNDDAIWFSVNLGNTNATCTPFSSCVGDGEMLPFIRFTAAPYALNSDLLDGLDASAFAQLNPASAQSGSLNVTGSVQAATSLQAPLVDNTGTLGLGTGAATTAVTVGRATSTTNLTLQGSAATSWSATSASGSTTVSFVSPTTTNTIRFQNAGGDVCTTVAATCSATYQAAGSYLAKNAADTSSASIAAASFLYGFTNSNGTPTTGGVLRLDNGANTGSTLSVTSAGNAAANQALISATNTHGTPTGNLIDLRVTAGSRFAVDAAGAVTTSSTINAQTISATANFTGTVAVATSLAVPLLQTADAAGATAALTVRSGNSTTSGNTGGVTLGSGAATSGNSGNVAIDSGAASGTAGNVTVGTGAFAHNVTVGNTTGTSTLTLQAGSGTIVLGSGTLTRTASGNTTINLSDAGVTKLVVTNSGAGAAVVSAKTGYQINGANAASGAFLRGDGTNFVSGTIQSGDIPVCTGSCNYISNQTTQQTSANFNISGTGTAASFLAPLLATPDVAAGTSVGLVVRSGNGTAGSAGSGNVTIDAGSKSGAGASGNLYLGTANTPNINIGRNSASNVALTVMGTADTSALVFSNAANTAATTITITAPTGARAISFPNASGSVCLDTGNCSGSNGYILNQNATDQTANFRITGTGQANTSLLTPTLDTAAAAALNIGALGAPVATVINLNQNVAVAAGKTLTVTSALTSLTGATVGDALNVSNSTSTGNIAVFKDDSTNVFTLANGGAALFQPVTDTTSAFNVKSSVAGANGNVLTVDTLNGRLGVNLGGTAVPASALDVVGTFRLTGSATESYITPRNNSVPTKINIPVFDPGAFGQILAFGLHNCTSAADATDNCTSSAQVSASARGLVVFDNRRGSTNAVHQPSIGVFSPDENSIFGLSWDGSDSVATLKTIDGSVGSDGVTVRSGNVTGGTGETTGNVIVKSGDGTGTDTSTGSVAVDSGAPSGAGVAGNVIVGTGAFAHNVTVGNTTGTSAVTLQAGSGNINLNAATVATNQSTIALFNTTATTVNAFGAAANVNLGAAGGTVTLGNTGGAALLRTTAGALTISSAATASWGTTAGTLTVDAAAGLNLGTGTATGVTIGRSGVATVVNGTAQLGPTAGSGALLNNGSTVNTVFPVSNLATGGSIGSAATTVDIYTYISVAQTTAGQAITIPTPTANTTYGRLLYLSNIGTASFTLLGTTVAPGSSAALVWANTNGGATWTLAGADGSGILNQSTSDQAANFRINGTGRANTSFISPKFDSISGVLDLGVDTATGITIGGATTTGTIAIGNAAASTINIGTGAQAHTIGIGTDTSTVQGVTIGSSSGGSATTLVAGSGNINLNAAAVATNQPTMALFNTTATTVNAFGAASNINLGAAGGTVTLGNTGGAALLRTTAGALTITSAAAATWSTSAGALTVDAAAGLNLGTSAATSLSVGRTGVTTTVNGTTRLGASAGTGALVNNGSTVNTVLAVGNLATGGTIGSAATTVDIYTYVSVAQTTAGQTVTIPAPTANTTYGRMLYLSNIGTASFTLLGTTVSAGSSAALVWANASGGAAWTLAGADGSGILNQNSSDQTADFRISGTGRANTSFTGPLFDALPSGALNLGTSAATGITLGKTGITTTTAGTLQLGATAGSGALVNNGTTKNTALAIANLAAGGPIGTAAATVDIYTAFTINQTTAGQTLTVPTPTVGAAASTGRIIYISNIGSASFTLLSGGATVNAGTSATLIFNGTAWTFAGADGSSILNQTVADQSASYRITGTGVLGSGLQIGGTAYCSAGCGDLNFATGANRTLKVLAATSGNAGNNLTIAAGDGTGTNQAGGALVLQGGLATGTGAGGVVTVRSQTNWSTAFTVQNAGSVAQFTVDTANSIVMIGDSTNGASFGSTRELTFSGTARHTRRVTMAPEYDGATMTPDGAANAGFMTSDFCSGTSRRSINTSICTGATDEHNYYGWSASVATQDYDVWVRHQLPSDFVNFSSSTAINMFGARKTAGDTVTLSVYKPDGTLCGTATNVATNGGASYAWTETALGGDETACALAANDVVNFRIQMVSSTTANSAFAGEIRYDYLSKW